MSSSHPALAHARTTRHPLRARLIALATASAILAGLAAVGPSVPALAGETITVEGTHSTIARAAAVLPALQPAAPGAQQVEPSLLGGQQRAPFVPPLLKRQARARGLAAPAELDVASAPHAADVQLAAAPSEGQLLQNFRGLGNVDQFRLNGFVLEPPDQGLCVGQLLGSTAVAEIINDAVAFYTPSGDLFSLKADLNSFFHEPFVEAMSDPRCYFDPTTQTWFFTVLALNSAAANFLPNHVDVLVLDAQLRAEFIYQIDVTFPTNTAGLCPCLGDQPKLGIDKNNLYISVDQFDTTLTFETGDSLIVLPKSELIAGRLAVDMAEFHNLALAGLGVTALQPAITTGDSDVEYLLNSFPYADAAQLIPNTISKLLGLWALSDTAAVGRGGVPKLSATLITSEMYGFPVAARTTNGRSLATFSNDSRMQQVQFINGHLWGALDSAVAVDQDPITRDGAAWFEIQPVLNASGQVTAGTFTDQGYLASAGQYLVYPAITTTAAGTTGIAFSITSPTLNPSTGYAVRNAGAADFGSINLTATGSGPDIGFTCALGFPQECRWGDYSWSTLDPNGRDIWMAAERIVPEVSTQNLAGQQFKINWGTQVWEVMGGG